MTDNKFQFIDASKITTFTSEATENLSGEKMKTQEITVTIKAKVPIGNKCWETETSYKLKDSTEITSIKTKIEKCGKLINQSCSLFPLSSGIGVCSVSSYNTFEVFKCRACLDACANGTERALKELAE